MTDLFRTRTVRWVAVLLAVLVLTGGAYNQGGRADSGSPGGAVQVSAVGGPLGDQARRDEGDPLAMGAVDAPVTLVMFSDYRCPFCARYARVTQPELIERYVESGELRIEWRDFPIFGDASLLGARAGRAAAAQDKFWEFIDAVYAAAPANGHHDLTVEKLRDFAVQVDMPDLERFERGMTSDIHDEEIAGDMMQGRILGVTGTPAFIIDGHPLVGAQPNEVFVQIIEQSLAPAN